MSTTTILGVFTSGRDAARAVETIRKADLGTVATYSPTANHALLDTQSRGPSPVRLFTLAGGLIGGAIGIAGPVYTMVAWPLIVGGKPIISIPPLVIISFELAMLGAALGGLLGFLAMSGLPRVRATILTHQRFTDDRFGVLVTCPDKHHPAVRTHLERAGAEEVSDGG